MVRLGEKIGGGGGGGGGGGIIGIWASAPTTRNAKSNATMYVSFFFIESIRLFCER